MLEIKKLQLTLGKFTLNSLDLKIELGEYFVILGPSGSGKTVLLETIAGLYNPNNGSILYDKEDMVVFPPEKRDIGFVYQNYELFPHMTVEDNIVFGLKIRRKKKEDIAEKLKELVSILKIEHLLERYPRKLSGGEKQRVALARALIISPRILLLDEPLSALDMMIKSELQKEIKNIHSKLRPTIIHVTHDLEEALFLGDRIGIMRDGNLLEILEVKNMKGTLDKSFISKYFKI